MTVIVLASVTMVLSVACFLHALDMMQTGPGQVGWFGLAMVWGTATVFSMFWLIVGTLHRWDAVVTNFQGDM